MVRAPELNLFSVFNFEARFQGNGIEPATVPLVSGAVTSRGLEVWHGMRTGPETLFDKIGKAGEVFFTLKTRGDKVVKEFRLLIGQPIELPFGVGVDLSGYGRRLHAGEGDVALEGVLFQWAFLKGWRVGDVAEDGSIEWKAGKKRKLVERMDVDIPPEPGYHLEVNDDGEVTSYYDDQVLAVQFDRQEQDVSVEGLGAMVINVHRYDGRILTFNMVPEDIQRPAIRNIHNCGAPREEEEHHGGRGT